jgi:hypothetical protein
MPAQLIHASAKLRISGRFYGLVHIGNSTLGRCRSGDAGEQHAALEAVNVGAGLTDPTRISPMYSARLLASRLDYRSVIADSVDHGLVGGEVHHCGLCSTTCEHNRQARYPQRFPHIIPSV